MQKISLFFLFILQIQSILKSHHMTGHTQFSVSTPKTFKLIFMKLYQDAKNKLIPLANSILESSNQIGQIKMLKWDCFINLLERNSSFRNLAIWLADRILAINSGTRFSPKELSRNTANKNFQYRINTVKINYQIFLWSKKSFSMKSSCHAQIFGTMSKFREI